jgi:hypothetical protein
MPAMTSRSRVESALDSFVSAWYSVGDLFGGVALVQFEPILRAISSVG